MPSRLSRVFPNSFGASSTGATVGLEGLREGVEGLAGVVGVVGWGGVVAGGAGFRGLKRSGILNFILSTLEQTWVRRTSQVIQQEVYQHGRCH